MSYITTHDTYRRHELMEMLQPVGINWICFFTVSTDTFIGRFIRSNILRIC